MERYLPNADRAYVEREKVLGYLLSMAGKGGFFLRFGFLPQNWQVLQEAILQHGRTHPVAVTLQTDFGINYVVEGLLQAADGRQPLVRSIWEVKEHQAPRLVSAYPIRRRNAERT